MAEVCNDDFIMIRALMGWLREEKLDAQMARVFHSGEPRFPEERGSLLWGWVYICDQSFIYLLSAKRNP